MEVELYTQTNPNGIVLVTRITIPPFPKKPEGILWGERFFRRDQEWGEYVEGMLYVYVGDVERVQE